MENYKLWKFKCEILSDFQTMWRHNSLLWKMNIPFLLPHWGKSVCFVQNLNFRARIHNANNLNLWSIWQKSWFLPQCVKLFMLRNCEFMKYTRLFNKVLFCVGVIYCGNGTLFAKKQKGKYCVIFFAWKAQAKLNRDITSKAIVIWKLESVLVFPWDFKCS